MKERVHWIDIAKGAMIIGMVLNHINLFCSRAGVDMSAFPWNFMIGHAYGVFTMQSFFILSGYTSNFNDEPAVFLKKQVKSLLVPWLAFSLLRAVGNLAMGESLIVEQFGENYLCLAEGYWFLTALFMSKVMVYFFRRLSSNKVVELGGGLCSY